MLKIVYPICCGMDVHKSFVVACVATTDEKGVTIYKSKRFSTFTGDLRRLAAWLAENRCWDVCMESTGKYWIPICNILEPSCKVVLSHPKYVKTIRGKKTDKRDAKWIADIFKHDLVSGSVIPLADIRQLRDLVRYCWKLTNFTTGEKNRAQNCLPMYTSLVSHTHRWSHIGNPHEVFLTHRVKCMLWDKGAYNGYFSTDHEAARRARLEQLQAGQNVRHFRKFAE